MAACNTGPTKAEPEHLTNRARIRAAHDDTPSATGIQSAYTDMPKETDCRTIGEVVEAFAATLQCSGYGDIPIFIKDGDLCTYGWFSWMVQRPAPKPWLVKKRMHHAMPR